MDKHVSGVYKVMNLRGVVQPRLATQSFMRKHLSPFVIDVFEGRMDG